MTVTAVPGKIGLKAGKPRLIHEEVIDYLLMNPGVTAKEAARHFGMSYQWMLILTNSDGFQRRYAERKDELIDPTIRATLEDRMKGLVAQSIEVLMEKLEAGRSEETALKALDIGSRALGYGAKPAVQVNAGNTTNFVVQVPPKARDVGEWVEAYAPRPSGPGQPALPPMESEE
jgi:hypothetical protein